jgi:YegS/Rv2252/BmrU family lipid kinase
MKKLLFVYNPRSGKGLIKNCLSSILELFCANGYDVTVRPTQKEMDACEVVCSRVGEFDLIVCSGGDGTLDEVVMGLMNSGMRRPIGYIPAGSTNDFGSSLGIPKNMVSAAEVIVNGQPFSCDIGKFNDDYFVYVAAFGFMTDVSYQTNQEMKNILGHTAYIIEGVKRLGDWKSYRMKIESEEFSEEGDYIYGMISNSTSVGGFKGLPGKNVELDDGVFEVMLVRTPRTLLDWQEVISGLLMQGAGNSIVVRFKTSHLTFSCEEPVSWTRDGENGGEHTVVELTDLQEEIEIMAQWEEVVSPDEAPS